MASGSKNNKIFGIVILALLLISVLVVIIIHNKKAIDDFTEGLKYKKDDPVALFLRARAYFELKNYENALSDLQKMKQLSLSIPVNQRKIDIKSLETGRSGSDDTKIKYPVIIPANRYTTPWRYIMAGQSPSDILQNNFLILNLNEENKIENPSFIKPGKVIREVTLTTQGGIACVDFAKKHNLQFVEFDAGWYGSEHEDESDATTISVDPNRSPGPLDLHHVIGYAKENRIGIILYVNHSALERQLDELLPLYKSWGVVGLKYGFIKLFKEGREAPSQTRLVYL